MRRVVLLSLLLVSCEETGTGAEEPSDGSLRTLPASVVALNNGQPFELRSRAIWKGVGLEGVVIEPLVSRPPAADLTGVIPIPGGSGESTEVHRFECIAVDKEDEVFRLRAATSSPSDVTGSMLASSSVRITCLMPTPDARGDQSYSNSASQPGLVPGYTDIVETGAVRTELTQDQVDAINDTRDPLLIPNVLHVTHPDSAGLPAGAVVAVATRVAEPIPIVEDQIYLFYSVVFETDGRTENNWMTQGDFDWDQFQGADVFFQALFDAAGGFWTLQRILVGDDQSQTMMATDALFTIRGDMATWIIPEGELSELELRYRAATFASRGGTFAPEDSGGDVNGADPTEDLQVVLTF
ncbi:MAG: hypothetical protein AAGF12_15560 [Myxococcota bacterium]